jgi:hypothetical protein
MKAGPFDLTGEPEPEGAAQHDAAAEIEAAEAGEPEGAEAADMAQTDPFPVDRLPVVLREMAAAIAEVGGVPVAMAAPLVLAAASASIGRGVKVKSLRGKTTGANLYLLLAKQSGSGGSGAYRLAMAPLAGFQASARRHHAETVKPGAEADRELCLMDIERVKKEFKQSGADRDKLKAQLAEARAKLAEIEQDMQAPLFLLSDGTSEGAAYHLNLHGETLAHFDSDAADAIASILGKYSEAKDSSAESLWLKCFDGEPVVIVRKNSGVIALEAPTLAVCFVATPAKVRELFAIERLCEGGLLPRFLVVDPQARALPMDEATCGEAREIGAAVAQSYEAAIFAGISHYRQEANAAPHTIDMEPEARRMFARDWNAILERTDGRPDPFAARETEQAIRLALLLHIFRHMEIEQRGPGTYGVAEGGVIGHTRPLRESDAAAGLAVRDWFARRQSEFLAARRVAEADQLWERVRRVMQKRPEGITARDLYSGRRFAKDKAGAEVLLAGWIEDGRIHASKPEVGKKGRQPVRYRLSVMQATG